MSQTLGRPFIPNLLKAAVAAQPARRVNADPRYELQNEFMVVTQLAAKDWLVMRDSVSKFLNL